MTLSSCCDITGVCLSSCVLLSDWCGVAGGEQAGSAPKLAFPPGRVRAFQDLDDVASAELQFVRLLSEEAVQSSDLQPGGGCVLGTGEEEEEEGEEEEEEGGRRYGTRRHGTRRQTDRYTKSFYELYRVITIFFGVRCLHLVPTSHFLFAEISRKCNTAI